MKITSEQIRREAAECEARKVEQARRMSERERFFAGVELFEEACKVSLAGMKAQHPDGTEKELRSELKRLIDVAESRRK